MNFSEFLKNNVVYLDGGMGTLLQSRGLKGGERPEEWNITHPEIIREIHEAYFRAGSNVVSANTFGANSLKFEEKHLEEIIKKAIENVRCAAQSAGGNKPRFAALDVGPLGKLLKPLGDLDFEDAVNIFKKTIELGVKYGADLIFIETMNDSYETKAALLAAKEVCDLPVMVSNAYGEDGKLMTGATPEAMCALVEGMGASAIGANCSLGPKKLSSVIRRLLKAASIPVLIKPNAGIPRVENGRTVFDVDPDSFALEVSVLMDEGVRIAGGCCGTTPEYISALTRASRNISPKPLEDKNISVVSSYTHALSFGEVPLLIGERINPTGKKRFKEALVERDISYILSEGIKQEERGVHALDVNVGIPEIDEKELLPRVVCELQAVTDLPLQIDTSDFDAMEKAMRLYNGKPMINSVSGKEESMHRIFPLMKKYGGLAVALTLDEKGIPDSAEGRVEIAKRIIERAKDFGISKKDLIFDTLAMTVSADSNAPSVTLDSLKIIREELGCKTSLGVSNVSFGLPARDVINATFFTMALQSGLSAAIMNPHSIEMMKSYRAFLALKGLDENCAGFIGASEDFTAAVTEKKTEPQGDMTLKDAVIKGFCERAQTLTREALGKNDPLTVVNSEIIPAMSEVGEKFEKKEIYLPSLLMSAEAARAAFEVIKKAFSTNEGASRGKVVIATVKGDIHDIGKNIVKLLLENYSFEVIDLGKDVSPEAVVESAENSGARLVGLSALMTTTVPAMEETVRLLRSRCPDCKIMVGGAVLTRDYADAIGADFYAKDAMAGVRYAQKIYER